MRNFRWWTLLALVLSVGLMGGCGGPAQEKTTEKGAENKPEKAGEKTLESPSTHVTVATEPAKKKDASSAAPTSASTPEADTPKTSSPTVNQTPAVKTPTDPAVKPAVAIAAGAKLQVTSIDPAVQKQVKTFGEKLPGPANRAPNAIVEVNNLKQIGLAFHNFHDVMNHFPALNGIGEKDVAYPGLSWRVYLLPFLGQAQLYNEFHHDEPWDSEHNKTLIPRMPEIFGKNEDGKTSIHVLTGPGAPFQNDQSLKFADIVDGTSNTILCVVAGADKAEVWTNPVGLTIDPKEPFKCLGKIGEQFPIGMMDGSVRRISKNVPPEQLAYLMQHADRQVITDAALTGSNRRARPGTVKIADPVTPLGPVSPQLDMSFIPADTLAALVIHPRRIFSHPVIKTIREQLPTSGTDADPGDIFRGIPMGVGQGITHMGQLLGIAPQNLDEAVVLLDKSVPGEIGAGLRNAPPPFGVILRNSAPIDINTALTALSQPSVEVQEFEGVAMLVEPREKACVCFINNSLLIVGHADFVKKMISAQKQVTPTTALTKRLHASGNRLIVMAVDGQVAEEELKELVKQIPLPFSLFSAYFLGAKEFDFVMDLDAPVLVKVNLQLKKAELATGLFGILEQQWTSAQEQYANAKPALFTEPAAATLQPYADQIMAETKLAHQGDTVTITVPQLKELDKLVERLGPTVKAAKKVAEDNQRRNNLKQIGLAFHNYHDVNSRFPALNGPGDTNRPHPGLSWRVYLLPYLDQAPLYNQFKLDEPWDSEHNKALIPQMPKIFGTNAEGKTSFHVFTGPGAPFQDDAGVSLRDITDGSSNTLLTIEAGADVVEIWTKPGGLKFDPDDPLKCLGETKDYWALMMDGATRRCSNVNADVFKKLVQHADGEPVNLP